MSIWKWLWGGYPHQPDLPVTAHTMEVNPATGLPMVDRCQGFDVGGNPFGMDWQKNDFSAPVSHINAGCDMGAGLGSGWPD
jgi:hypothetical protein